MKLFSPGRLGDCWCLKPSVPRRTLVKWHANARSRRPVDVCWRNESSSRRGRSRKQPTRRGSRLGVRIAGWLVGVRGDRELLDRSSAPRRVPRRTSPTVELLVEHLRRLRMTSTRIAAELGMAVSTVGVILKRLGLHRLSRLEPPEPPNCYERRHPGELVHLDIKRLSRFRPGRTSGHRRRCSRVTRPTP